jgi:hypothetical protein
MKFATLTAIALCIAAGAALSRLLPSGRPASPGRTAFAALLLALVCAWGVVFPLCYALNLDEIPQITWSTRAFGFPPARIAAREQLLHEVPAEPGPWRTQGFRWFVLDSSEEDTLVRERTELWVAEGEARLAATFGELDVVELLPQGSDGAELPKAANP